MLTSFSSLALTAASWFCLCSFASAQNLHWQRISDGNGGPPARRGSAIAWTPQALYLFGGEGSDGVLGDMWKFSLLHNAWEELRLLTKPAPRYGFVAGVFEDYWYITHGKGSSDFFQDTWVFSFAVEEWHQVNITEDSDIPEARGFAAGGASDDDGMDDTMMLWISMGTNKVKRKLSDTWTLSVNFSNPFQGEWQRQSQGVGLNQYDPTKPHARSQAAGMAFSNGRFIISGGCSSGGQVGGPCPLEDSWVFHSSDSSWSKLPACPIPVHSSSMVPLNTLIPDVGLLYGGTQKGPGFVSQLFPTAWFEDTTTILVPTKINGFPPLMEICAANVLSSSSLGADEVTLFNVSSLRWSRIRLNDTAGESNSGFPSKRSSPHLTSGVQGIYLFGGESVDGSELLNDLWLLETTGGLGSPESLPCTYTWFSLLHLHGVLMYIAWGLCLPFGAMMGRYYRWSWPVWFVVHVICQVFGTLLTVGGFIVVFMVAEEPSHPHGVIGILLMFSIVQQFLSGLIRPWLGREDGRFVEECKDRDSFKYRWRRCWEVYHRVSGVIAIALGFTQVTLGVFLINAPVPVWAVWIALLSLWLTVFLFHEIVHCFFVRLHKD